MQKRILTTGEAAKYCGVHFRTVARWIDKGLLKAHKLPGRGDNRIQVADFIGFLQENDLPIPPELTDTFKVLIIEDEPVMAKAIQRALLLKGYETQIVNNSFEAGTALLEFMPHLVTLDLKMPGFDGFAVIEYIKNNIQFKPGILVVSGASKAELQKAANAGADDYLEKPFDNQELVVKIQAILGR